MQSVLFPIVLSFLTPTLIQNPSTPTSVLQIRGNLPAEVHGPFVQTLESQNPFSQGSSAYIQGGATQPFNFSAAGSETMEISINGGAGVAISFQNNFAANISAVTAFEAAAEINADLSIAGVSGQLVALVSKGRVYLMTVGTGDDSSIRIIDGAGHPALILGLSTSLVTGSEAPATITTTLNSLPDNTVNYVDGDLITISGTAFDGDPFVDTFVYGSGNDGITLGSLINFINGISGIGATVVLDDSGNFVLTADDTDETSLSLSIFDNTNASTGRTSWSAHTLQVHQMGTEPDRVFFEHPICDATGVSHTLGFLFERRSDELRSWNMIASIDPSEGSFDVGTNIIYNISFTTNGLFNGSHEPLITVNIGFGPSQVSQSILCDFGAIASPSGITHRGGPITAHVHQQNGFGLSNSAFSTAELHISGNLPRAGYNSIHRSVSVCDPQGNHHDLHLSFQRQANPLEWNLRAYVLHQDGTVPNGLVSGIQFQQDGSFVGTTQEFPSIDVQFTGSPLQRIYFRFDNSWLYEPLRSVDNSTSVEVADLDGCGFTLPPPVPTTEIRFWGRLPKGFAQPAVLQTVQPFAEGQAAVLSGVNSQPFDFSAAGTETMLISINGGTGVIISFQDSNFSSSFAATAHEVAKAINADLSAAGVQSQLVASVVSGRIQLTTTQTGKDASIHLADGTNLPAWILGLSTSLVSGSEHSAAITTFLNDLPDNYINYVSGDQILISGNNAFGDPFGESFLFGAAFDGNTLGDLVEFINSISEIGAVAMMDAAGNIVITANEPGWSPLNLTISDNNASTGQTSWSAHVFDTNPGQNPHELSLHIGPSCKIDGESFGLVFRFVQIEERAWNLIASISEFDGDFDTGANVVSGIRFNKDGSFNGSDSANAITVNLGFGGNTVAQTIQLHLGTVGQFDGLTQDGDISQAFLQADANGCNYYSFYQSTGTVRFEGNLPESGINQVQTSIQICDSFSNFHEIAFTFNRRPFPYIWDMEASLPNNDGEFLDNQVQNIRFNQNGSLQGVFDGTSSIVVQFPGINAPQEIYLNFGSRNSRDGLTESGNTISAQAVHQDGCEQD